MLTCNRAVQKSHIIEVGVVLEHTFKGKTNKLAMQYCTLSWVRLFTPFSKGILVIFTFLRKAQHKTDMKTVDLFLLL